VSEPAYWPLPASEERPNEDAVFFSDGVAVVVDGGAVLLEDIRGAERFQRQQLLSNAIKIHDDASLVVLDLAASLSSIRCN
jgi:hypothetical protein